MVFLVSDRLTVFSKSFKHICIVLRKGFMLCELKNSEKLKLGRVGMENGVDILRVNVYHCR